MSTPAWCRPPGRSGHDMGTMDGMMSGADMDGLGKLTNAAFDTMWLQMMVKHHTGAITMANTVIADGSDPDVLKLAATIITAQQGEIQEMNALLVG